MISARGRNAPNKKLMKMMSMSTTMTGFYVSNYLIHLIAYDDVAQNSKHREMINKKVTKIYFKTALLTKT